MSRASSVRNGGMIARDHGEARCVQRGHGCARTQIGCDLVSRGAHGEHRRRMEGPASCAPGARGDRSASSRVNTPARHAATYSPRLWPIIAAGSMPHDIHNRASAYSTTNSAGCVMAVCVICSSAAARFPIRRIEDRAQIRRRDAAAAPRNIRRPRGGSAPRTRSSVRPMLTYCAPWPGNRNATPVELSLRVAAEHALRIRLRSAARSPRRDRGKRVRGDG